MNLPSQLDFDPWNGDLDALSAWEKFGGLDIDLAHEKFRENPIYYQDAFLWMGPKALEYYFPVIERHLREYHISDEDDSDGEAWILGCAMASQIEKTESAITLLRIADLASFIRSNLTRYATQEDDIRRVDDAWKKVESQIQERNL